MANEGVNQGRRRFLTATTAVVGGAGAITAAIPFIKSWQPSARAKNAGAPVLADISKVEPGQRLTIAWRGAHHRVGERRVKTFGGLLARSGPRAAVGLAVARDRFRDVDGRRGYCCRRRGRRFGFSGHGGLAADARCPIRRHFAQYKRDGQPEDRKFTEKYQRVEGVLHESDLRKTAIRPDRARRPNTAARVISLSAVNRLVKLARFLGQPATFPLQ